MMYKLVIALTSIAIPLYKTCTWAVYLLPSGAMMNILEL